MKLPNYLIKGADIFNGVVVQQYSSVCVKNTCQNNLSNWIYPNYRYTEIELTWKRDAILFCQRVGIKITVRHWLNLVVQNFVLVIWTVEVTECGSVLHPSPEGTSLPTGWGLSCYISPADSAFVNTQCRDLIKNLPGIGMSHYLTFVIKPVRDMNLYFHAL